MLAISDITNLALDLTSGLSNQDRFDRLLTTVRTLLKCDASALLLYQDQRFVPLAINGLAGEVLGRRFALADHPRLEAIARAGDVVRFPADSSLPDPYDGLIPSLHGELKVHACIGLPLLVEQRLIGAVTIDGFDALQFNQFSDDELRIVTALAAASLNNALQLQALERAGRIAVSNSPTKSANESNEMIGRCEAMVALKRDLTVVATSELSVLVLGETGVGKELVAQQVHQLSNRAGQPLVYLNCAALPDSVAESELFGHVKGAFTGAISHRQGKFELADEGTLFLDEIGELSLELQAKLLRVLQYGDVQRVGEDKAVNVDVRIVAATNRDLKQEVAAGRFRADLYHRLSVFPVLVPPLRERHDDVVLLAGYFLERCSAKLGLEQLRLSAGALTQLQQYQWPGNVRELEHCINRAAVLARAESNKLDVLIESHHLALTVHEVDSGVDNRVIAVPVSTNEGLKDATERYQRQLIEQALQHNNHNWAAVARQLQLDSGNLHRLAKRLGLK
ncbi:nitric oxide reductase transcriptional regulator NorR [Ferrimonas lipolytica]|uniref:Nitric oxide reductase transcriptional regulator NorR n=1 Tax=Ferrimonas lipolytica TaxID=2724191 RepID=A0A6H1UDM2_9GAMM|nr:nitric oxide reductase transcriptional regulator NorR [Ferrimonas lipolytica]QIZ77207.1 nitric oxide reductase transcriptional regulator NorR [Ferrimonas lipolytica]